MDGLIFVVRPDLTTYWLEPNQDVIRYKDSEVVYSHNVEPGTFIDVGYTPHLVLFSPTWTGYFPVLRREIDLLAGVLIDQKEKPLAVQLMKEDISLQEADELAEIYWFYRRLISSKIEDLLYTLYDFGATLRFKRRAA